ncbi:family 2A encapsulin nanocompartment cargo protein cysteine desulfurase [Pelomonas cellulosilytica]|uniref:Cysteine desulfurase n=2 Tax=Bacteria TaxID=2 RepID=A0ABS8XQ68_9BURK|nr:family 2A encapsulin nanocompartment cargo protein cysteine desulfurase [Pelomonas sp. P8]MCE4553973.1 cysteine desulfurase [Pelomonas sp. P8]
MSTLTPTADVVESPFDVASLARLANELFGSLSTGSAPSLQPTASAGGLNVPANPLPPGLPSGPLPQPTTTQFAGFGAAAPGLNLVPSGPDQAAALVRPSPARAPHALAGNGVPDVLLTSVPGIDGRAGSQLLGVPQAITPPARQAAAPEGYYFLEPAAGTAPQQPSLYVLDLQRHPGPHGHHAGEVPNKQALQGRRQPFDVHAIRRDFPILSERVNGRQLVWFDNAATTQKPRAVIDRLTYFYEHENSNIHRAAHTLAARATDAYEAARKTVAQFVNARSADEVIFVRGATEAINLVANTWGEQHVGAGDEIVVSHLEHHANIVPWQQLAARKGAHLRVIPVDDTGQVILSEAMKLIGPKTRLLAVTQVSNALGTVVPVRELVDIAQRHGVTTLVDGAQSVSHLAVDVQAIGCDFFIFSGHKIFGPTGIGAVVGRKDVLDAIPPWQGGGNMIADVTFERTVFQPAPMKFEAGTGNIADAAGLGAALDYVNHIGLHHIARYEHDLLAYATEALRPIPGVRLVGTAADKASVLSFVLAGHETSAVGAALAEEGIAVRSGHHCAQPILRRFGLEATVRPSFAFYNTCDEIDHFIAVVRRLARA